MSFMATPKALSEGIPYRAMPSNVAFELCAPSQASTRSTCSSIDSSPAGVALGAFAVGRTRAEDALAARACLDLAGGFTVRGQLAAVTRRRQDRGETLYGTRTDAIRLERLVAPTLK
jgi:hypothetical protein